ncbi:hypothetical protein Lal_00012743 [Lupinus albus]|nr:hypothetical protein Lal_00012743 [Lupinus albus]
MYSVDDAAFNLLLPYKLVLASHRLERYVINPQVPLWFLFEDDREFERLNMTFLQWEEQDQHLVSRLLQSLSESIWDEIHTFFDSLIRTPSQLLLSKLRTIKKRTQSMIEFVSLEGLSFEYESFVTTINNRAELCSFVQLKSLLMAHETYLERIHPPTTDVFSVNVAHSSSKNQFSPAGMVPPHLFP